MAEPVLAVSDLATWFHTRDGVVKAVDGADLEIGREEIVTVVGESGSGKSVTALSVMRLIQAPGRIERGRILFDGTDLLALEEAGMRTIRGTRISMIFQNPYASLHPSFRIGDQMTEALVRRGVGRGDAVRRSTEMLERIGIDDPVRVMRGFAFEVSAGVCQRVMLAMALMSDPELLIADEPTTNLDCDRAGADPRPHPPDAGRDRMSVLLITHDFGSGFEDGGPGGRDVRGPPGGDGRRRRGAGRAPPPLHRRAHRVGAPPRSRGRTPPADCRGGPRRHPPPPRVQLPAPLPAGDRDLRGGAARRSGWRGALRPLLAVRAAKGRVTASPALVEVRSLVKDVVRPDGTPLRVVDEVSFGVREGETFGLAGVSGSGKSLIGRMILNLIAPTSGDVLFEGRSVAGLAPSEMQPHRPRMQMVFQNPLASMNPRKTAGSSLELPLINFGLGGPRERKERSAELLDLVGLSPRHAQYYPHEFSGGQCQRLGIARALASRPKFIFLDEPVSALDVSIQAQMLNLLKDLQEKLGLTYLFVANNLNVLYFISDRIAVLDSGRIIEEAETQALFAAPREDLTRSLLSAMVLFKGSGPRTVPAPA